MLKLILTSNFSKFLTMKILTPSIKGNGSSHLFYLLIKFTFYFIIPIAFLLSSCKKDNQTGNNSNNIIFTDSRDGNVYKAIKIGEQVWMVENLRFLPSVERPGIYSIATPKFYVYGYNGTDIGEAKATANFKTYGVLYNQAAAIAACPEGWHLPSHEEWTQLTNFIGDGAGGKMKEVGISKWKSPNLGADNKSGFNAIPGGRYYIDAYRFERIGEECYFWSSSSGRYRHLGHAITSVGGEFNTSYHPSLGFSVRCLRN